MSRLGLISDSFIVNNYIDFSYEWLHYFVLALKQPFTDICYHRIVQIGQFLTRILRPEG